MPDKSSSNFIHHQSATVIAFILHFAVAFLFRYLYQRPLKRAADWLLGQPESGPMVTSAYLWSLAWTGTYLRALCFVVMGPYLTAELLLMAFPVHLLDSRWLLLLPHYFMLLIDPRMFPLVAAYVRLWRQNS